MISSNNNRLITNNRSYASVLLSKNLIPPSPSPSQSAIADSGATDHFITLADSAACSNHQPSPKSPCVAAANGSFMKASHSITVPLSTHLSPLATTGHVLKGLSTNSLISISKLCDDDCVALFTKYDVRIMKNGNVIIRGQRQNNGLWNIPFAPKSSLPSIVTNAPSTTPSIASSAIRSKTIKADLAAFLHGTLFSPVLSTLVRAIKRGHFTS